MSCSDLIFRKLREEIVKGHFGESGSLFMQTRQLTAEYHISTVRAQKIIRELMKERLLVLCGKHYYVSTGAFRSHTPGYQSLHRANYPLLGIGVGTFVPVYSALIEKLTALGDKNGYRTVCMYENSQPHQMLDSMLALGVHGMFYLPMHPEAAMPLNRFVLPTVVIGKHIDNIQRDTITMDNYQAGILAAEHLLQRDCQSFCYVGYSHNLGSDRRYAGFEKRIVPSGRTLNRILIQSPDDERLRGHLQKTLSEIPHPIGFFCYTDLFAMEVLRWIRQWGWQIPSQIRIIGCDNLPQALTSSPPLTSIHYNCSQLAQNGIERMIEQIAAPSPTPHDTLISPSLFVRESTSLEGM